MATPEQLSEVLEARPDLRAELQRVGITVLHQGNFIAEVEKTIEILEREKLQKRVLAGITDTLNERWGSTADGAGCIQGLTLEKIKKAKEVLDKAGNQAEWEDVIEFVAVWDKRQELYEWMHSTLGLKIYK